LGWNEAEMKDLLYVRILALFLAAASGLRAAPETAPGPGISEALAKDRAASISSLRYQLRFAIPERRTDAVHGQETVRFTLRAPRRVVLDFGQPREKLLSVRRAGQAVDFAFSDGHLIIPSRDTTAGENAIEVEFIAGDEALNRNDEFIYTLFVPARAHLTFPCFDQPDMKARYTLALEVPGSWQAVANGVEAEAAAQGSRKLVRFAETRPVPTYLFAFAAGKFSVETAQRSGRVFRMFHRETDAQKVARNREAIFDLHARALAWLEEYTGIPYPWGKFDFVLIPSFQFGGMEHPGAILYNSAGMLLDESATQNQYLGRANTISHETAHMWFGDLITMRWFNDVWMKEVMANFMAGKIVNPSFPEVNHDLRFLLANYPAAYGVDRTAGTNPIRQTLANLNEAGSLYGAIIYEKAPVVMRQLEKIMGETAFRDGLREYLKRYGFGNATWLDLVRMLDARTPEDLATWSHAWVEERGRPELTVVRTAQGFSITQRDPMGRGLRWPQKLQVTIGYADRIQQASVSVNSAVTRGQAGQDTLWILPNGGGLGYGLFLLDDTSLPYLLEHVESIPDALTRGSAWVTLWDNLLEARIKPSDFLDAALRALPQESDEQNTQLLLRYAAGSFWQFLSPPERAARAAGREQTLREGLTRARTSSQKSAWFTAFRNMTTTREGLAWLERVWRRDEKIEGLTFAETDEINMALELAVREVANWRQILATQLERTQNPDRKARFEFVMPALSADPAERERAFERFRSVQNRRREPWVTESLQYLNHPLRQEHAVRFIGPGLNLLEEIRATGDIFFPTNWSDAILAGHNSREAAQIVRDFLTRHPQLPEHLRWTVLSAADDLFRSSRVAN
jgi:aminopeptidase N